MSQNTRYSDLVVFDKEDADLLKHGKCDKYDYLISVGCGAVAGFVDVFLVGMPNTATAPNNSILGAWTDKQVDNAVKGFSKLCGWKPRPGNENNLASAIGFLEKKFKVNYDHRHTQDVGGAFNMSAKNHHMKSLAHSPSPIGLFFSILNQFTSTASFASDGRLIVVKSDTFELQGSNFISKLFCGFVNWLGHIMSDVAGTSGGRGGGTGRGSGVVIPFYELFSFCNFGEFQIGKHRQDLATLATRAFQEGYDFRHGLAMAIPVLLTEILIKLIWSVKRYFYHKRPLKECIPINSKHSDLRMMLLIGNGTLCVIDGIDAGARSGGDALTFFLRLNLVAWFRLTQLVVKEVLIRMGIAGDMQEYLESFERLNKQLADYCTELEKIDKDRLIEESEYYSAFAVSISSAQNEQELNVLLRNMVEKIASVPWDEDGFDDYINDPNEAFQIIC
jgi:hypothetical protein